MLLCVALALALSSACTKAGHHSGDGPTDKPPTDVPAATVLPSDAAVPMALVDAVPIWSNAATISFKVRGEGLAAYRFTFGVENSTDCSNAENYGVERGLDPDLVLAQTTIPEGPAVLCLIGGTADGRWQSPTSATRTSWSIDRIAPAPFSIETLGAPAADGRIEVRWTVAADTNRVSYELGVVPLRSDGHATELCQAAALSLKTNATAATIGGPDVSLPPGRIAVCVRAIDEAGNRRDAMNSVGEDLERPSSMYLSMSRGTSPADRRLSLASMKKLPGVAAVWRERAMPLSKDEGFEGRAMLALTARDDATMIFLTRSRALDADKPLTLRSSTEGEPLLSAAEGASIGAQLSAAFDKKAHLQILHLAAEQDQKQVRLTSGDAQSTTEIIDADLRRGYRDASIAVDANGTLHLAYVKGGALFYRQKSEGHLSAEEALPSFGCDDVALVKIAAVPRGGVHAAILCNVGAARAHTCKLLIARRDAGSSSWESEDVAASDAFRVCSPFNDERPSLAVDLAGKDHLAFRLARSAKETVIAYASDRGRALSQPQIIGTSNAPPSSAKLALDADDRVSIVYLQDGRIMQATEAGNWLPSALQFDETEPHPNQSRILELMDFAITSDENRMPSGVP